MRTKLSKAITELGIWSADSLPDRKTALAYFRKRYKCEKDGIWYVHLDQPLAPQSPASAIFSEVQRRINA